MSGWHGVTSVALGNCGFGFAPSRAEDRDRAMLTMTRNEAIPYDAMKAGMPWDWVTFPDFIESLNRTPKGVNCLTYVPLTPLYAWVMGWEEAKKRRPTEAELQEMCRLIHEAMDAGACGWSAQVLGRTRSNGISTGPRWSPICSRNMKCSPSPRYWPIATKASSNWRIRRRAKRDVRWRTKPDGSSRRSRRWRSARPVPGCRRMQYIPNNTASGSVGWKAVPSGDCVSTARASRGAAGSR